MCLSCMTTCVCLHEWTSVWFYPSFHPAKSSTEFDTFVLSFWSSAAWACAWDMIASLSVRLWCLMPFRPTSCLSVQICLQLIQHDCKNKLIGFVLDWTYNIFNCLVVSIISGTMESQENFVTNRSLYHCSITALSLLYHCSITLLSPKYLRLMDMVWVQWPGLRPQLVDFCFRLSAPSWIVGALSLFNGLSQSHLQGSKIDWVVPHSTSYSVCIYSSQKGWTCFGRASSQSPDFPCCLSISFSPNQITPFNPFKNQRKMVLSI